MRSEKRQNFWRDYQWLVIAIFAVVALVLGYIGFGKSAAARAIPYSFFDAFYDAIRLFTLESGAVPSPVPWELEVARLLAPVVVAYTAATALAAIFYEHLQLFRIRFVRGHVIICGLGRKGLLLARHFAAKGRSVIVIDLDEENSKLATCRALGATVLIGNAADMEILRKARLDNAKYLFSVCGNDGTNAEVAINARTLVKERKNDVLESSIHIANLDLRDLLRELELSAQKPDAFRLDFFNVFERGACAMISEFPFLDETVISGKCEAEILVVGLGQMGCSLVAEAGRIWKDLPGNGDKRLHVTIIDRVASERKEKLLLHYPQLAESCDIKCFNMEIHSPEFERAEFLLNNAGQCLTKIVYVCLDNDAAALSAALTLYGRLRDRDIRIVVRMSEDVGLAALLREEDGISGFRHLYPFSLLDKTCAPDRLPGGTHEVIAQAIHADYVQDQKKKGATPETNPSMVSWDELPDYLKESNRRQADHIGVKLKAAGCGIAPLKGLDTILFEFTSDEVERLAEMEHERWNKERKSTGWRFGPKKDIDKKITPYLLLWNELPDDIKQYDRNTITGLSTFLSKAGFMIYRLKKGE